MGLLSRWKSERDVWEEVVAATGGYVVGEKNIWGAGVRVEVPVNGGTDETWRRIVTLDVYTLPVMVGKVFVPMTFARAIAPFPVLGDGLRLSVAQANPFTKIGKLFGMQDIEIGDDAFDRAFVIKGSDPAQVQNLLGGELGASLREVIQHRPGACLGVSDDGREATSLSSGSIESVPAGSDVVYAVVAAAGSEEIVTLFGLVAETIRGLYRIGVAAVVPAESPAGDSSEGLH